jgi:hypothetical protein
VFGAAVFPPDERRNAMITPGWGSVRRTVVAVLLLGMAATSCKSSQQPAAAQLGESTETIVLLRHGEKPPGGLGQLSCIGLNRALALPDLLIGRYGRPDYIYAPSPSDQVKDQGALYSYVRPLATIEPTAIRAGLPVNAQIGYKHIDELQRDLTQPAYANSRIFVAWEHGYLREFAVRFLKSYGGDASAVPPWPGPDFDSIYVFHLTRHEGKAHLDFRIDHENLESSLSNTCPGASHS